MKNFTNKILEAGPGGGPIKEGKEETILLSFVGEESLEGVPYLVWQEMGKNNPVTCKYPEELFNSRIKGEEFFLKDPEPEEEPTS